MSDAKGDLASVEDTSSKIYGFYVQESVKPADRTLVDMSVRYDTIGFDNKGTEYFAYDYGSGTYVTGDGDYKLKASYKLLSAKAGVSYA